LKEIDDDLPDSTLYALVLKQELVKLYVNRPNTKKANDTDDNA
jgi:hypothetical protein